MFNLLISGHETAWEGKGRFSMDKGRFKEHSGDEAATLDVTHVETLRILERVPTILMYEKGTEGVITDKAKFGELRDIRVTAGTISFRFHQTGELTQKEILANKDRLQFSPWEEQRTHWAVKDGDIPQDIMRLVKEVDKQYDIVLSYASEDRQYVQQVASYLEAHSVEFFYDQNEAATLWGKNLTEHFQKVFNRLGRYCVMFISKHYAEKVWTTHERRSALGRQLEERKEYILPARFDATVIDGLHTDLGYVDLKSMKPDKFGALILEKLGRVHQGGQA